MSSSEICYWVKTYAPTPTSTPTPTPPPPQQTTNRIWVIWKSEPEAGWSGPLDPPASYAPGKRIIYIAHIKANIDKVSFVTSYSHASDFMTSCYGITTYAYTKSMILYFELSNPKSVSDIYSMFIEPTITWVLLGFTGYMWLDTKIVLKIL